MPTGTSARRRSRTLSRRSSSRSPSRSASVAVLRAPPRPLLDDAPALPDDEPARPHLSDAGEDRPRGPRAPEREDLVHAGAGRVAAATSPDANSAFASEPKTRLPSAEQRVVERTHAEAVAHERQPAPRRLPPRERELAVEPVECGGRRPARAAAASTSVSHVVSNVSPRATSVGAQLGVVVDLAVVDEHASARGRLERLPATRRCRRSRAARRRALRRRRVRARSRPGRGGQSPRPCGAAPARRPAALHSDGRSPPPRTCSAGGVEDDRRSVEVLGGDAPPLDLPVGDLHACGLEAHPI